MQCQQPAYGSTTDARRGGWCKMAILELAVLFFVLAIVAAIFGATGVAGVSMSAAKWLVIVFIVLAVLSYIL